MPRSRFARVTGGLAGSKLGMEHLWIILSVVAALLQAVRTAAQRDLNRRMSTLATTYVRSLFGLPVMIAYLAVVMAATGEGWPRLQAAFLGYTLVGAMAQVAATMLLISMFRLKNFGVGTMLTKCDVVITAVMGAALFSETLSSGGVLALVVVMAGVVAMSTERAGLAGLAGSASLGAALIDKPTVVALGCACCFSVSYLTLREASLVIGPGSFLWRGAWTVVITTAMQTVIVGAYIARAEPGLFKQLRPDLALATFIGVTSAVGSIGWFTAFALQNASYVRAVGQIEVVFTLLIAALYYHERVGPLEVLGIVLTLAGVLMFRLAA